MSGIPSLLKELADIVSQPLLVISEKSWRLGKNAGEEETDKQPVFKEARRSGNLQTIKTRQYTRINVY